MAIPKGIASLLIEEHLRRPFQGRLLQLGRQRIFFSLVDFQRIARRHGFVPANHEVLQKIQDVRRQLTDEEFFGAFGFSSVCAPDYEKDLGASFTHDLNSPDPPKDQIAAWDCVFDGGTLEHVFNVPNALKCVCQFLSPAGRVIHYSPASNCVDHGFYSLSPCLFHEFYRANGFRVDSAKLLDMGTRLRPIRVTAFDYVPPIPRSILDGYLTGNRYMNFFVATKTEPTNGDRVPQQQFYQGVWDKLRQPTGSGVETPGGILSRVKSWLNQPTRLSLTLKSRLVFFVRLRRVWQTRSYLRSIARPH
jgi:hypothetical protein